MEAPLDGAASGLIRLCAGNDMGPVTPETGNHVPFTEIDVEILGSMTDAWDANIFIQRAEDDKWVSDETEGKNGIRLPAGE